MSRLSLLTWSSDSLPPCSLRGRTLAALIWDGGRSGSDLATKIIVLFSHKQKVFTIWEYYLVEECDGDCWWEGVGVAVDLSLWLGDCEGCMLATSSRSSSLGTGNWTPFFFSSM